MTALCVARAILRWPALLLDEPTAGVDRMLRGLRACLPSSSIVVASHDPLSLTANVSLILVGHFPQGVVDNHE